jgi:membrane-associated phospholipid phosphatase
MKQICYLLLFIPFSFAAYSQQPDTLIKKLDSLSLKKDNGQVNNTAPEAYNEQTKITFRSYFILLGSTLKQEFTKPFHMKKKDWGKLGAFALATVAVSFADEPVQKQALKFRTNNIEAAKVSKYITNFGGLYEFYGLGAVGAYAFIFKNQKLKTTTLLATQAYLTGAIVESALKYLTGRTRPSYYSPAFEAEPTFKGPFGNLSKDYQGGRSNSSFPSGHATVAFAAATVYAMEYKSTIWVPILSYSLATMISASRITENKHWTTDVFVGAVLGYLSGRHIVNNYHRYAKLKAPQQPKNTISFNLQYDYGQFRPGLIYHIR